MRASESKAVNYAAVAQRDKLAAALAAETGCGFVEAWTRVMNGEPTVRASERISGPCSKMQCENCEEALCRHFCHVGGW